MLGAAMPCSLHTEHVCCVVYAQLHQCSKLEPNWMLHSRKAERIYRVVHHVTAVISNHLKLQQDVRADKCLGQRLSSKNLSWSHSVLTKLTFRDLNYTVYFWVCKKEIPILERTDWHYRKWLTEFGRISYTTVSNSVIPGTVVVRKICCNMDYI